MECASQRFLFNIEVLKHEKCNLKKKVFLSLCVLEDKQSIMFLQRYVCVFKSRATVFLQLID